jgi:hypothetical protein
MINKFKIGDWVIVDDYGEEAVGYIVEDDFDIFVVQGVRPEKFRRSYFKREMRLLEPYLSDEDINTMIDLALDLMDEVWFNELVTRNKKC